MIRYVLTQPERQTAQGRQTELGPAPLCQVWATWISAEFMPLRPHGVKPGGPRCPLYPAAFRFDLRFSVLQPMLGAGVHLERLSP